MNIEEIQQICCKLKGVTEDIKWENHLCFNVGGKMFLVTAPDNVPVTASIKVSEEEFAELPDRDGIIPAPYMARHKWVFLDNINRFSKKEWKFYIAEAHRLVGEKLPRKNKKSSVFYRKNRWRFSDFPKVGTGNSLIFTASLHSAQIQSNPHCGRWGPLVIL
jgi:predicted DNA-binding protein (MmcQ/YjbR family)